jgi:shikimate kinase
MNSKLVRTPALYLVGFMGSGKSTVGAAMADELGWEFIDLDADIEASEGTSITEVFSSLGEEAFRRMEYEALHKRVHQVQCGHPAVISLGGGAFAQEDCYQLASENGITIWLDCPLARIRERIKDETHRPLARDPVRFEELYHIRAASYARADFRIEIASDNPVAAVDAILKLPLF